jgi:hypothetical protein
MVTALELDPESLPTTSDGFDIANDEDSLGEEHIAHTETSTPNPFSLDFMMTDEEFESEEAPVDDSTTVAEQAEIHFGRRSNAVEVSDDNNNSKDESTVILSPMDCATLDVLKLCHDAGVSLEFYGNLFALLRKHSSKNKVDITKLPKRDTFLKTLRARISSPTPIISQVGNLQVPHFDVLSQIRDLLGSFIFNDLNNLCVNMDPAHRYKIFAPADDDKYVEMCAQEWYQQTYAEFIKEIGRSNQVPLP